MKQNLRIQGFVAVAGLTLGVPIRTVMAAPQDTTTATTNTVNKSAATRTADALPAITAAPGSPEEVAQLRALVQALSTRLQNLEVAQHKADDTIAKNAATTPTVSSASKLPLTISGLLQVRGDAFSGQSGPAAKSFDSLRLRRAEIRLTAPSITPRLSGTVLFDPAKRLSLTGTPVSGVNQGSNILQEVQLSYLLRKARGGDTPNNIYLDAGQFKLPIGYEGDLVSSSALPTVERALMFAARDPFGGGYGDIRDTGVQVRGTQGAFRYWLGVFNGLGERQNNDSSSDTKALIGRVAYSPRGVRGLMVGVSGARGNNRNVGTVGSTSQRADRSIQTAFISYQRDRWTAHAEYLTGSTQRLPLNTAGFDNDIRSYYGLVGYKFTPKIEGVLQYDFLDLDRGHNDAIVRDIVLGVNYYIKGNNAKIQANIVRRSGGSAILAANGFSSSLANQFANDRTEFRLQAQVGF